MIVECRGNLLEDHSDILVNTVNCVGIMGKGLALSFKKRWPSIEEEYKSDCNKGLLFAGDCKLYNLPEPKSLFLNKQRKWAAFCTKNHWKNPSEYEWIINGLKSLEDQIFFGHYDSVSIPPLGCGNGGLEWNKVYDMIKYRFEDSDIIAYVYLP